MGGGAEIFELLAGEDVNGNEMDLGVAVLAGLRCTHLNDLAGARLDDHKTVLTESGALHRIGGRGASVGALKGVLMLWKRLFSEAAKEENEWTRAAVWRGTRSPLLHTCASSAMIRIWCSWRNGANRQRYWKCRLKGKGRQILEVGFAPYERVNLMWMIEKQKCVVAGRASIYPIGLGSRWKYQHL